jgi:hypothetical protein
MRTRPPIVIREYRPDREACKAAIKTLLEGVRERTANAPGDAERRSNGIRVGTSIYRPS